jgi:hypothetical protein
MATKDVLIDVPLLPTLQENKDKQNVAPPGFLRIEDAYLDREGGLRKRDVAAIDETLVVGSVTTPSFVASYNDGTVVGTTDGVYQFAANKPGYNNSPGGTYDAVVDHVVMSGIPTDAVEVDSSVSGSLRIVAFTYAPQALFDPENVIATDVWYVVFDASTGEMVKSPQVVGGGTGVSRPRVVVSSTSVSFWWIDAGSAKYTTGVPVLTATTPGTTVSFSTNTLASATDISWCRCPSLTSGVFVATILGGVILPVTFTNAGMGTATLLTTYGFSSRNHRFVSVLHTPSSITGGVDSVYACGYEGVGAEGIFSVARYNIVADAWTANAPQEILWASPLDTANGYAVPIAEYDEEASRLVLGLDESSGSPRLTMFGTCYYTMALKSLASGSYPANAKDGVGCCTTFASLAIDTAGIVFPIRVGDSLFSYAVVTESFRPLGKLSDAVGVVRSGIANAIDIFTDAPMNTQEFLLTSSVAEGFSSCVFVCPSKTVSESSSFGALKPLSKAFDLRVSETWNRVIVTYGGDKQASSVYRFPFSVARCEVDEGVARVVMLTKPTGAQSSGTSAEKALEMAIINMAPEAPQQKEENGVLSTRNMFTSFDGAACSESSIFDVPLMSVAVDTASDAYTNANVPAPVGPGVFFRTVYSFVDGKGNKHRSAPSPNSAPWGSAALPNAGVAFGVWDMPVTTRQGDILTLASIELYRASDPSGGVFSGVGIASPMSAVRAEEAPHILVLLAADARAPGPSEGQGTLYTEGGVLESQSPPSFKDIESGKGRMWGLADNKLFYTKPIEERVAPEWNYALTLDIPDDTGKTVGVGSMDDKVVAFTERGTYVVYGDGPNALGTGGTFAQLLRIPGNIGCIARGSIVECPLGVAFLSQQGFYLLDRGLNLAFIGKPVEDSVDRLIRLGLPHTIVSAVHDIGNKHVRFIVDSSMPGIGDMKRDHYVWYYETNQWGRFTSFNELQSVYSKGRVLSLFDRGVALGQRTIQTTIEGDGLNTYGPFVAPLRMAARTGWINLGNIEGFERVKRMNFLYTPGHDPADSVNTRQALNVRLYSQFRTTPADSTTAWSETDLLNSGVGIMDATEFSVQPRIQKCASMSVEFEEADSVIAPLTYQNTQISGLTMRIGKRRGLSKMNIPAARRK